MSELAEVRITYRTVRVLAAIYASPGASNRVVADLAGVADLGQISRMLRRVQGLDLICNTRPSWSQVGPNSWEITEMGERLLFAMSVDPADERSSDDRDHASAGAGSSDGRGRASAGARSSDGRGRAPGRRGRRQAGR